MTTDCICRQLICPPHRRVGQLTLRIRDLGCPQHTPAPVAEQADAPASSTGAARHGGSTPPEGT